MPLAPLIHITAAYSNAVLVAILPHVSDYAKKLDLPIPLPITMRQVTHFGVNNIQGVVGGGVSLTNHYLFSFQNGYVDMFRLNKNNPFIDDDPAANWPKYAFGKINMTTNEAIEFARQSIAQLGYDIKALHVDVPPDSFSGGVLLKDGNPYPYCEMMWQKDSTNVDENYYYKAYVNMNKKQLVGLTLISRQLWQTNPPVSVTPELESDFRKRAMKPMTFNTNAPKRFHPDQILPFSPSSVETNSLAPPVPTK